MNPPSPAPRARRARRGAAAAAIAASSLLAAACAGGDDEATPAPTTSAPAGDTAPGATTVDTVTVTTPGATTTTGDPSGPQPPDVDPVGEGTTAPVAAGGFPAGAGGPPALLTDVRVGAHGEFARIVLEFRGDARPSYRVAYIEPPVRQDGSGMPVDVAGSHFLEMRLSPASGHDLTGPGEQVYTGPERLAASRADPVAEVVRVGDFEAQLAWVAGLDERRPFAVELFEDPTRLVVDVLDER